jgi:peptide/nickel transport system permease protein
MIETPAATAPVAAELESLPDRSALGSLLAYCSRNPHLVTGLAILLFLLLIGLVGPFFVDVRRAQPTSELPTMPPSLENPLGTDDQGRDLLAVMVRGLPLTLRIGFLAGAVGLGIGAVLGLLAGYRGGWIDALVRVSVDTLLTVPGLLILIMVAASIKSYISVDIMALVIASLAWRYPARTVRSQVLTLRERAYVQVARLSGMGSF